MDRLVSVFVPDIGDFKDVKVSEILVKAGDRVNVDDPLITLETDKATMETPSPMRGVIREMKVGLGDTVSQGSLIMLIERLDEAKAPIPAVASSDGPTVASQAPIVEMRELSAPSVSAAPLPVARPAVSEAQIVETRELSAPSVLAALSPSPAYATPAVRRQARELGIDIAKVSATGQKGRITKDDVLAYVKGVLSASPIGPATSGAGSSGLTIAPLPFVDFAKYGPIERQPLSRIKTISGANLARNWVTIPHVTNFDEADVTDVEVFRQAVNKDAEASGVKVTMLTFLIKAVVATLKQFKTFNASLDGDALVLKNYFHIGFAADTPRGLLVPVLRDADRKGILDVAAETAALAKEARDGKLRPDAMQGGCFSISSLGGIGGTGFTPIINAPEVAILGVAKAATKPVWDGAEFRPRLIMPLCLSWDHRVVDGAEAGRFLVRLAANLGDIRRLLL
jgi:pyruvate dehydrogenase E2 component (dihydrolipoamide acetyltransferase)